MDIRQLLNKLDRVALSEAISLKDVEAAVAGIKDEQERAAKLNDLAWNNKLPGLYDPVSGNYVAKQSQPNSMGGRYNISASSGRTSDDKTLASMGLIPQKANTSTALGRMFRGDDKGEHDKEVKGVNDKVNKDRQTAEIKADKLPKLKALVDKLKSALGNAGGSTGTASGMTGTAPSQGGLKVAPATIESSIFESLLREFQEEIVDEVTPAMPGVQGGQGMMAPAPGNSKNKDLVMQIQAVIDELSTVEGDKDIEAAIADAQAAIKADVDATDAANKATAASSSDNKKIDPTKLARFKELLAKAGPAKAASVPGAVKGGAMGPKTESMAELMARVQRIAEGQLNEALTPEEKSELDALAKELEAFTGQDPELDALLLQHTKLASAPADADATSTDKPGEKKAAGADPAVQKVQEQLKALGVDPGPIDGRMGPKTVAGIKAFQQMAGITVDGKIGPNTTKALADGKNIIARSQLTQSLTAIEALVTKYKISESVTEEDVLAMTESEARSFVMKNIKYFSEAEQIGIMRDYLSEAPVPALPGPGGNRLPAVTGGNRLPVPAGNPNVIDVPFKDITPKQPLGWGQRAMSFVKGLGKKVSAGVVAGGVILGTLYAAFSGGDIEMDPADLAELQKHLKVLDQYGKDPAVKTGLPADVQKRLDAVIAKLDKLKKVKGKAAAPAAAKPAAAAPGGNISNAPAA